MQRISGPTVDVDEFGTGKDGFTSGDPASGVPPTELSADWCDAVQEEIASVVEDVVGALDADDNTQLLASVREAVEHPKAQGATPNVDATATASNATALKGTGNGTGAGVTGVGGATDGSYGVDGSSSATNGGGMRGTGSGTGPGVHGVSQNGPGLKAEGDATSPAKEALLIVPQDADPSSPDAGGVYANATSKNLSAYDGQQWARLVGKVYGVSSGSAVSCPANSYANMAAFTGRAGSLRVGSAIRLKGVFRPTSVVGLPNLALKVGGTQVVDTPQFTSLTDNYAVFELEAIVRTLGASGTAFVVATSKTVNDGSTLTNRQGLVVVTFDTTAAWTIAVECGAAEGGAAFTPDLFLVDLSD